MSGLWLEGSGCTELSGSSTQNRLPLPGSLSTPISPPMARVYSRQIDNPIPVP